MPVCHSQFAIWASLPYGGEGAAPQGKVRLGTSPSYGEQTWQTAYGELAYVETAVAKWHMVKRQHITMCVLFLGDIHNTFWPTGVSEAFHPHLWLNPIPWILSPSAVFPNHFDSVSFDLKTSKRHPHYPGWDSFFVYFVATWGQRLAELPGFVPTTHRFPPRCLDH